MRPAPHPLRPLVPLLALLLAVPPLAAQNLRTDGSTGAPAQTLSGPQYLIGEALGRRAGGNLFHSFQSFDLHPGESATFSVQSSGIANVISRVTGGAPSLIYGSLRLEAAEGAPALFFINPAGVLFGQGASIDVPGAFHASTAAHLRMTDGSRWDSSGGSSFSVAAPEAFGFVGGAAAPILLDGASLAGATHQALSLTAGNLQISGSELLSSGGLRLVATGSRAVELGLQAALPGDLGGFIGLDQGSVAVLRAEGAQSPGRFEIAAGDLSLTDGALLATLTRLSSSSDAGPLQIRLGHSLFMDGGSALQSVAATAAQGGAIEVQAGLISLSGDAYLWTYSEAAGQAGRIDLQASQALLMSGGANLFSSSYDQGDGGLLRVRSPLISLDGGAFITSEAHAAGRSGAIDLVASEALMLQGSAAVTGVQAGSGDGGDIRLDGGAWLWLGDGARVGVGALGSGRSGLLELRGDTLQLDGGATVRHRAEGLASSGDTRLIASELLRLAGAADLRMLQQGLGSSGDLLLQGGRIEIVDGAGIGNNGSGLGRSGGNIALQALGSLLVDGANIASIGVDGAHAGDILLQAQTLSLRGDSTVSSSAGDQGGASGALRLLAGASLHLGELASLSANTAGDADAGSILLQAPQILLDGEARINAATSGAGRGGDIELNAGERLRITEAAGLLSSTQGPGEGGRMRLRAPEVQIDGQALLFANSSGSEGGHGGAIRIEAGRLLELGGSASLDSSSFSASGHGGQIELISGGDLRLRASTQPGLGVNVSALLFDGSGRGGNLLLQAAGRLELGAGSRVGTATSGAGDGGTVHLLGAHILLDGARINNGSFDRGNAGSVSLQAQQSLELRNGAIIGSSAFAAGTAGRIELQAANILLTGGSAVLASASTSSSGQTGDIRLQASERIRVEGQSLVSIGNEAVVANPAQLNPTLLRLQAPRIELDGGALVASASGNVDASRIELRATDALLLRDSGVSTTAQDGNGGSLLAQTGGLLLLERANLLTSVLGTRGNGGDIELAARTLLLDGGFIQANTAAANASGGDVRVDIAALIARGNRVAIGGDAPLVFDPLRPLNVIQAAAPDGVSGMVAVSNTIDLGSSLALLERGLLDSGGLARSPCERRDGSALVQLGRGGLPGGTAWRPPPAGPRDQPGGGCR